MKVLNLRCLESTPDLRVGDLIKSEGGTYEIKDIYLKYDFISDRYELRIMISKDGKNEKLLNLSSLNETVKSKERIKNANTI